MYAYCECGYETDDYPTKKEVIKQLQADGGKCKKKDKSKCKIGDYTCPKCGKKDLSVD